MSDNNTTETPVNPENSRINNMSGKPNTERFKRDSRSTIPQAASQQPTHRQKEQETVRNGSFSSFHIRGSSRSSRKRRCDQLTQLHEMSITLTDCDSPEEVSKTGIKAASDILDFSRCAISNVEENRLSILAGTSELPDYGTVPLNDCDITEGSYKAGNSCLIHNGTTKSVGLWDCKSALVIPIGDHGMFHAISSMPKAFTEKDLHLAEILVEHVSRALCRIEEYNRMQTRCETLETDYEQLEELISLISHDVRNPLNVAQLRVEYVLDNHTSPHLQTTIDNLNRVESLIDDLLTLATADGDECNLDSINLKKIAEKCWDNVATVGASLTITEETQIQADSAQFKRLLENLFRNAVEHGGDDVTVRVGVFEDKNGFYVEDDGDGMNKEVKQKAFDSGFTTQESGTGLGLEIVSQVAQAHNWTVFACDSHDEGARFEFTHVETFDESNQGRGY